MKRAEFHRSYTGTIPLDRLANIARTDAMSELPEHHPLARQFNALTKQIAAGHPMHPMEIWDLVQDLREAGANGWADRLADFLPD